MIFAWTVLNRVAASAVAPKRHSESAKGAAPSADRRKTASFWRKQGKVQLFWTAKLSEMGSATVDSPNNVTGAIIKSLSSIEGFNTLLQSV
jgi:hypothetical protein